MGSVIESVAAHVQHWGLVFYAKGPNQGVFQFDGYVGFMNEVRHILSLIYHYFKLGL